MSLKIISTFGDHSSLYPLATKDIINSIGMTAYSYDAAGSDKNEKVIEAKDRFIDEFGTEAIWLGGLPFFKWLADKTIYKAKGYNPDVDVRLINDKNQLSVAKKYADKFSKSLNNRSIANDLLKAENNSKLFKGLFIGKFVAATALTLASYFTLTVMKQKYTDKQVLKRELEKRAQQEKYNRNIKNNPATSHIPVILLTAQTAVEQYIEGYQTGADDYITKPFNTRLLISRCNNLVNSRILLQEKFSHQPETNVQMLATNKIDKELLDKAISIIEANIGNSNFNMNIFAREMGMARTNLFAKIKAITGQTPNDFIISIRLKKGAYLLRNNPELNITEIAEKLGFSSARYFSKCFKDLYNISPLSYRKKEEDTTTNE